MGMTKDGHPDPIEQDTEQGEDGPDLFTRVHDLEERLTSLESHVTHTTNTVRGHDEQLERLHGYVMHLQGCLEAVNQAVLPRTGPARASRTWEEWLAHEADEVSHG